MKKYLFILFVLSLTIAAGAQDRKSRLTQHVYYLAADSLQGRKAGTGFGRKAAEYIRNQYEEIGIKPYFSTWEMPFARYGTNYADVVGVIEGSDPVLKNEYIVLGAHYDHLGVKNGNVYNGADDNASGSAALIEIARDLYAQRGNLKRSVIIAAFDAEELGLFGSEALSDTLVKKIGGDKIKLMMSIDMVGWYKASGKLKMEGVATIRNGRKLLLGEAKKQSIAVDPVNFEKSLFTATDTEGFAKKGVATLAVTTGLKSPYHKPEDDADLIDYDGLDKVSGYIADVTLNAASDSVFSPSGRVAKKHRLKAPLLEFGVIAGPGNGNIYYTESAIRCKDGFAGNAGVQLQVNAGSFGINARALYEYVSSKYPDEDNLYGSALKYHQQAMTVPVMLQYRFGGDELFFIGAGGYYSRVLDSKIDKLAVKTGDWVFPDVNKNQWGLQYGFGIGAGFLQMNFEWRSQLNRFFASSSLPKARLNTYMFSIGYFF